MVALYKLLTHHTHNPLGTSPFRSHGNVADSRARIQRGDKNLIFLLGKRLAWIAELVDSRLRGVEFGAGSGATRLLVPASNITLTDILASSWLDVSGVDAANSKFEDESFDYVFINNVLHHLPSPNDFLDEAGRILKPGGKLFIQEIHTSTLMRFILKKTNHESFDSRTNALTQDKPLTDAANPWDANCDVARQVFDNIEDFRRVHPRWQIISDRKTEFLTFLNSGGVVVSAPHLPLPAWANEFLWKIDCILVGLLPNILGLQRQLVLIKI